MLSTRFPRERNRYYRSLAFGIRLQSNNASMGFDNTLCNRKTQATATTRLSRTVGPIEAIESILCIFCRNANTCIGNENIHSPIIRYGPHVDTVALASILHRIVQHDCEKLTYLCTIGHDYRRALGMCAYRLPLRFSVFTVNERHSRSRFINIDLLSVKLRVVRIKRRKREKVSCKTGETIGLLDHGGYFFKMIHNPVVRMLKQQLLGRFDYRQGRSQLMGSVLHEFCLLAP